VTVDVDGVSGSSVELYAVPHLDTDGDERFDYAGPDTVDGPYRTDGEATYDQATVSS
jgi:hypothetical protein